MRAWGRRSRGVGNRAEASGARPEDPEVYSVNLLNQYTQRTVPRWLDLLGSAHTGAVVTVKSVVATGAPPAYTRAVRQKDYFHASVPVSTNGAADIEFDIFAVLGNAGSNGEDAVSTETGSKWIAPTPEIFTHDADGNLLSDGRFAYTWDGENRLVGASNAATRILFAYDPMSRRIGKTVIGGPASGFVYDGWNLIREVKTQGGSAETNAYIWGLDLSQSLQGAGGVGGLVATVRDGGAFFAAYDANGNVTEYVEATGATAAHYEYDPFGNTLIATGPMAESFAYRFSTKYWDSETGLYYYGHRFYRPEMGRWSSRDPLYNHEFPLVAMGYYGVHAIAARASSQLYQAFENNPVCGVDRLGLDRYITRFSPPIPILNPNGDTRWHVGVAVDKWKNNNGKWVKDGIVTFDFIADGLKRDGSDDIDIMNLVKTIWKGRGVIERRDGLALEKPATMQSSPCQDMKMLAMIEDQLNAPPFYSIPFYQCISWSVGAVQYGMDEKGGRRCCNPDGTMWGNANQ